MTVANPIGTAAAHDFELIESIDQALSLLHGKWKVRLLFCLARGVHRPSRLLACLPGASKKVMIETLRALERDGLVARSIFAEVPARVEYTLTQLGWSMTEPLIALAEWADCHGKDVTEARLQYHFATVKAPATGRAASNVRVGIAP